MFGAALQSASALPLGLLRNAVSGSKVRFVSEGYDLDLTYVTARIIAMGLPAESLEAAWRNSLGEVANFLHSKHPQCHRVYNLCDERDYDAARFHAALHLPFPDHHPPSLDALLLFVADARAWLLSDTQNVVAVHCKAGKGRTGVMITALLMALDWPGCASAHEALAVFRARRTRDGDACRNAGQVL
ncbi:protein-tyrosine phosphatase-like protein [Pavlovales sp. CCMP2436]|nr:protein-tyrosine phosphatase-like protein [Pavlovales sp. CCMP2436]